MGEGDGRVAVLVLVAAEAAEHRAARVLLQSSLHHRDPLEPAVDAVARQAQQPARLHRGRRDTGEPRRAAQVEAEEAAVVGAAHVPAVRVPANRGVRPRINPIGYDRVCRVGDWSCG